MVNSDVNAAVSYSVYVLALKEGHSLEASQTVKMAIPNRTIVHRVDKGDNGQMREENSDIAQVQ